MEYAYFLSKAFIFIYKRKHPLRANINATEMHLYSNL